jgi:hypothetical protein
MISGLLRPPEKDTLENRSQYIVDILILLLNGTVDVFIPALIL